MSAVTPDLSIEHFRGILDHQTRNLTHHCERWTKILESNMNLDEEQEETLGAIRSTIGQAKLLMSQRFKQFSKLIDDCESNNMQRPTKLEDLLGFWEMISYQIDDVLHKFGSLNPECLNGPLED